MNNLLTDIAGVRVGHADDAGLGSGVTAVIFDNPATASMDVRGGGPGTREGSLLDPVATVQQIHGIALAGGSAFGLGGGRGGQARHSDWRPAVACRPGSPSRARAIGSAKPSFRSCRALSVSICSTAATSN